MNEYLNLIAENSALDEANMASLLYEYFCDAADDHTSGIEGFIYDIKTELLKVEQGRAQLSDVLELLERLDLWTYSAYTVEYLEEEAAELREAIVHLLNPSETLTESRAI